MTSKIGVIAGSGNLPFLLIEEAQKRGCKCVVAGIKGEADKRLAEEADAFEWVSLGEVGRVLSLFKRNGVEEVILAGKVEHKRVFSGVKLDKAGSRLASRLKEKGPSHILEQFIKFMAEKGVQIIEPVSLFAPFLCEEGLLAGSSLQPEIETDINYGLMIAKKIADLDIGQTVVVKEKTVVGVEGMEGTNQTVKRCARLAGEGFVVVKVGRTFQDIRIDMPAVGLSTVETIAESGGRALCIEANNVLFFQKKEAISLAREKNILISARKIPNIKSGKRQV